MTVIRSGLIRKRRLLPATGNVEVQVGERVEPETVIGEVTLSFPMAHFVNIAQLARERPEDITSDDFAVAVGDEVRAGDVVAVVRRGWKFMPQIKEIRAPATGTVESIFPELGLLSIRERDSGEMGMVSIPVASLLQCRPGDILGYLRVDLGDELHRGDIVALREEGELPLVARSPHDGVVDMVNRVEGKVILRRHRRIHRVRAFVPGVVEEILTGRGAVIRASGTQVRGIFGAGGEAAGRIMLLDSDPATETDVPESCEGAILVAPGRLELGAVLRAQEVGAVALVAGSALATDVAHLLGDELGMGVTGEESLRVVLVLTEGFGSIRMDERVWSALTKAEGRLACVSGGTQMRAGVVRPEVIIPGAEGEDEAEEPEERVLRPGARVRIVRQPHFMMRGTVQELLPITHVGAGIRASALSVILEDGTEVTVLRANVEIEG